MKRNPPIFVTKRLYAKAERIAMARIGFEPRLEWAAAFVFLLGWIRVLRQCGFPVVQ